MLDPRILSPKCKPKYENPNLTFYVYSECILASIGSSWTTFTNLEAIGTAKQTVSGDQTNQVTWSNSNRWKSTWWGPCFEMSELRVSLVKIFRIHPKNYHTREVSDSDFLVRSSILCNLDFSVSWCSKLPFKYRPCAGQSSFPQKWSKKWKKWVTGSTCMVMDSLNPGGFCLKPNGGWDLEPGNVPRGWTEFRSDPYLGV